MVGRRRGCCGPRRSRGHQRDARVPWRRNFAAEPHREAPIARPTSVARSRRMKKRRSASPSEDQRSSAPVEMRRAAMTAANHDEVLRKVCEQGSRLIGCGERRVLADREGSVNRPIRRKAQTNDLNHLKPRERIPLQHRERLAKPRELQSRHVGRFADPADARSARLRQHLRIRAFGREG